MRVALSLNVLFESKLNDDADRIYLATGSLYTEKNPSSSIIFEHQ